MAKPSVLDSDLHAMVARLATEQAPLAPLRVETLARRMQLEANGADVASEPESRLVTVKLVVSAGRRAAVESWVMNNGGKVVSSDGVVLVVEIAVEHLSALNEVCGILRAEASRRLEARVIDARGAVTGLDAALQRHGLTGSGVVIGIIDSGVDWSHPDFQTDGGGSRIERLIHAYQRPNTETSSYDEFDRAAIEDAIKGIRELPQGDPNGHGTHCASIAAGVGRATGDRFSGVATGATLMAMRCDLLDDQIITGIRRFFAEAGDRPAVISLSLGGHFGGHDGTSAIEQVITRESGPGRVVVVAAGNEGEDQIHWQERLQAGQTLIVPARITDRESQFVDVWIPRGDVVEVTLETSMGQRVPIDGTFHTTLIGQIGAVDRVDPINLDRNVTVFTADTVQGAGIRVVLAATDVSQGEVHAWSGPGARGVFPSDRATHSVGMPATAERCIAVGSFVSRASILAQGAATSLAVGGLSPFSSRGPSRVGAQKPDVVAPGQFITAALADGSELATAPRYAPRRHVSGRYVSIEGTSMATPFVAGVIALMLEREPRLDPTEIRQRLRATARRDEITGAVWNPAYGYGKIDVSALLDYAQPIA